MIVTDLSKEPVRPVTKEQQLHSQRLEPKRGNRSKFSPKVRKSIIERDKGLCVKCGRTANALHHIIFRSAGGLGTEDNGCCICGTCHELAHKNREVRKWFERWRKRNLLRLEVPR